MSRPTHVPCALCLDQAVACFSLFVITRQKHSNAPEYPCSIFGTFRHRRYHTSCEKLLTEDLQPDFQTRFQEKLPDNNELEVTLTPVDHKQLWRSESSPE